MVQSLIEAQHSSAYSSNTILDVNIVHRGSMIKQLSLSAVTCRSVMCHPGVAMPPREFRWVPSSQGQSQSTQELHRNTIRSHAASVSHREQETRRQRRPEQPVPGQGVLVIPTRSAASAGTAPEPSPAIDVQTQEEQSDWPTRRLVLDVLSGVTFSPIAALETYHKPYLPGILDHYIRNLTIPIPELDGISVIPVFRHTWVPFVIYDPVIFQIVVLFSATHYATFADSTHIDHLVLELLTLKQCALTSLAERIRLEQDFISASPEPNQEISDVVVAAAAKLASYEAIYGTTEAAGRPSSL
jgi:hypothetical protein